MWQRKTIDYGQDAPLLLRNYLWTGGWLIGAGGLFVRWSQRQNGWMRRVLTALATGTLLVGSASLARGVLMIYSSRVGKVRAAERLLDDLALQGGETVLDVGCGRGLLLIKAAKRLPRGRAIGIDHWSHVDQGENRMQATLENARIEGVADRVQVVDGDMRNLSFLSDGSLDVVVASKSIHNIESHEGRRQALKEIVRVLKPGGRVALMDIFCVQEFAQDLQALGMQNVEVAPSPYFAFPKLDIVTGSKSTTRTTSR